MTERRKHRASSDLSDIRERIFVHNRPAAENARSSSTDAGGTERRSPDVWNTVNSVSIAAVVDFSWSLLVDNETVSRLYFVGHRLLDRNHNTRQSE